MDWLSRIILFPFSLIYGLVISTRNALYESGVLRATSFDLPVISVGNIKMGGTGKTPMVEWLIQNLAPYLEVGVLSRGFGRTSKGYLFVKGNENPKVAGDEALQIKRKFPMTNVAVSESRTLGVSSLLMDRPSTQVVILDDAFQHRSIKPSLNLVLTEYYQPYFQDYLLPMGKLREWRSAVGRTSFLIVSKSPKDLKYEEAEEFKKKVEEALPENIYFSSIDYGPCYSMHNFYTQWQPNQSSAVLLVSGIAEPYYLKEYFEDKVERVYTYDFPDHHAYEEKDVSNIIDSFRRIPYQNKSLVTTEKDIVKLIEFRKLFNSAGVSVFVQRVGVKILFNEQNQLENRIKDFLLKFTR